MLPKISNKLRVKRSVTTVAALGILLGAQVMAFADYQYDFNYGFNSAVAAINAGLSYDEAIVYYLGRCTGHFTAHDDVNECIYGAQFAFSANG